MALARRLAAHVWEHARDEGPQLLLLLRGVLARPLPPPHTCSCSKLAGTMVHVLVYSDPASQFLHRTPCYFTATHSSVLERPLCWLPRYAASSVLTTPATHLIRCSIQASADVPRQERALVVGAHVHGEAVQRQRRRAQHHQVHGVDAQRQLCAQRAAR